MRHVCSVVVGLLTLAWVGILEGAEFLPAELGVGSRWLVITTAAVFWRMTNPHPWR